METQFDPTSPVYRRAYGIVQAAGEFGVTLKRQKFVQIASGGTVCACAAGVEMIRGYGAAPRDEDEKQAIVAPYTVAGCFSHLPSDLNGLSDGFEGWLMIEEAEAYKRSDPEYLAAFAVGRMVWAIVEARANGETVPTPVASASREAVLV